MFDGAAQTLAGSGSSYVQRSNNGFTTGTAQTLPGADDKTGLLKNYVSGSLGSYYYPATGSQPSLACLRGAGSRSADLAGLYHHSTTTDNVKEQAGPVDIGFHYAAMDSTQNGLVGYWRLDETSGTTAADSSGNGRTGTVSGGAAWTTGQRNGALNFDGIDDAVSIANHTSLQLGNSLSLAFWVRKTAEPTGWTRLVGKGSWTYRNYCVWEEPGAAKRLLFQFLAADGTTWMNCYSAVNLETDRWYHVACTYDGTTAIIHINGAVACTPTVLIATPRTSTEPLTLGSSPDAGHSRFQGLLDDVRIFNRALGAQEVVTVLKNSDLQTWSTDADGDGLADYLEDRNGNGVLSTGETRVDCSDTDYDGRTDGQEFADGTDPLQVTSALPTRLGYWRFNDEYWLSERGMPPKWFNDVLCVDSFSGKALKVRDSTYSGMVYRDIELDGTPNINCRQGTVRFWFRPDWSSQSRGGTGPANVCRLIELGKFTYDHSFGQWFLGTSFDGNRLIFWSVSGGVVSAYTSASIAFDAGVWHQIVLTYGPDATAIFVDGQLAPAAPGYSNPGPAVTVWPGESARAASGMRVGFDYYGTQQAKGQFDELETFNYRLGATAIGFAYQCMLDPQYFSVSFTNSHVNATTITGEIAGEAAVSMAVLVNSTNFASATWTMYTPTFTVNLGTGDGPRDVWVGLKGLSGKEYWQCTRVIVDTTPPVVTLTSTAGTTSQPLVQIQGHCPEPLSSVRYDLVNATGGLANEEGFVRSQHFDTNVWRFTTNWFQCFDVELATGANTVTLRLTDLAGNVTTTPLTYTLDYSGDHTAPVVTLHWPQNGAQLSSDTFTLRAHVDDPTATVTVSGLTPEPVEGIIERNGLLWVEDLPLTAGANNLTLTVTDAAGNAANTSLTVTRTTLSLAINEPDPASLNQATITVTGTITDNTYTVWVNGVEASTPVWNGSAYAWQADAVPVNGGGTAILQARAIPNSDNGGHGGAKEPFGNGTMGNPTSAQAKDAEKAPEKASYWYVQTFGYRWDAHTHHLDQDYQGCQSLNWFIQQPARGDRERVWTGTYNHTSESVVTWPADGWSPTLWGTETDYEDGVPEPPYPVLAPECNMEFCSVSDDRSANGDIDTYTRSAWTTVRLWTGGKAKPKRRNLFSLWGGATEILDWRWRHEPEPQPASQGVPETQVSIGALGKLGADGYLYEVLPDGDDLDITPRCSRKYYILSIGTQKHRLVITANDRLLADDRVLPFARFCVGQKMNFDPYFMPPVPGVKSYGPYWSFTTTIRLLIPQHQLVT